MYKHWILASLNTFYNISYECTLCCQWLAKSIFLVNVIVINIFLKTNKQTAIELFSLNIQYYISNIIFCFRSLNFGTTQAEEFDMPFVKKPKTIRVSVSIVLFLHPSPFIVYMINTSFAIKRR